LDISNFYNDYNLPQNLGTRLANKVASYPRKKTECTFTLTHLSIRWCPVL